MNKNVSKKLSLRSETVRALDNLALRDAAGAQIKQPDPGSNADCSQNQWCPTLSPPCTFTSFYGC